VSIIIETTGEVTSVLQVGTQGPPGPAGAPGSPGSPGAPGATGAPGVGVPVGGTAGQVLEKIDGTNYNTQWATPSGGGGTWGSITGTLSNQTDLQSELNAKLTAANNLSDITNAATARTNLNLGDVATENVLPIAKGGTGQSNATAAINNLLPVQTGNSGKVFQTDGSNGNWVTPTVGASTDLSNLTPTAINETLQSDGSVIDLGNSSGGDFNNLFLDGGVYNSDGSLVLDTASRVGFAADGLTQMIRWDGPKVLLGTASLQWPNTDGTTGQLLKTDGSGVLSWVSGGASVAWGAVTGSLASQTDLVTDQNNRDTANRARANHTGTQDISTIVASGNFNSAIRLSNAGTAEAALGYAYSTTTKGLQTYIQNQPNGVTGNFQVEASGFDFDPLQNSPDEQWAVKSLQVNFDNASSGFTFGTNGRSVTIHANNAVHSGTGDIGEFSFFDNNFSIGNGTDPIAARGFSYHYGFGQINANVDVTGPMQGYGFQPGINSSATIDSGLVGNVYIQAFYDGANFATACPNYTSFNSSPTILSVKNNNNVNGLNLNPNITTFTGNAGYNGVAISGQFGTFNGGGWQGVNISPTITSARYAAGLNVSMDNVTPYAGVASSLVIQDLTYTFNNAGDNNSYSIEYTTGATAGSEVITLLGQAITVQIDSGVSTATQVKAAVDASLMAGTVTATITGTGSNAQVTAAAANFVNGENPGNVKAAYLDGDVEITGSLTFGGALSIGKLNAFGTQALVDGGGQPSSIHSLITQPTVAANATLTSGDTISVNTAALINIGDNATVGTSFIGVAALGLPAVLTMGTGSTLDKCYGALFALSLDAGAGGGTVDEVGLCKALALPNGSTTVNKLYGYLFDLPFGDPGTSTWGFYARTDNHNYLAGDLLLGGTAGSDDVVTNSSVALEVKSTTKAMVLSRMDTTARNALTAIAGMVIFNTTTSAMEYYDGAAWV